MIAEIGTGLSSLKLAFDIAKGLNAVATQAALNDVRIELQSHILNAQEALSAARDADVASAQHIRELEEEIMKLKDWEGEKQRYEMKAVDVGAFAYVAKAGMESGEPPHWLCASCFTKGQKSILQLEAHARRLGGTDNRWGCSTCAAHVLANFNVLPSRDYRAS